MFWAFFYYFQNLAKSLGRFSLILDPFFERFPLSNTQKSPKIFARFARIFLALFYFLQKISNFFGRSFIFYKKSPNVFGRSFSYGGVFNINTLVYDAQMKTFCHAPKNLRISQIWNISRVRRKLFNARFNHRRSVDSAYFCCDRAYSWEPSPIPKLTQIRRNLAAKVDILGCLLQF